MNDEMTLEDNIREVWAIIQRQGWVRNALHIGDSVCTAGAMYIACGFDITQNRIERNGPWGQLSLAQREQFNKMELLLLETLTELYPIIISDNRHFGVGLSIMMFNDSVAESEDDVRIMIEKAAAKAAERGL